MIKKASKKGNRAFDELVSKENPINTLFYKNQYTD